MICRFAPFIFWILAAGSTWAADPCEREFVDRGFGGEAASNRTSAGNLPPATITRLRELRAQAFSEETDPAQRPVLQSLYKETLQEASEKYKISPAVLHQAILQLDER